MVQAGGPSPSEFQQALAMSTCYSIFLRLHEWLSKPPWNYLALGDPSFREGRWEPLSLDSVTMRMALALTYLV